MTEGDGLPLLDSKGVGEGTVSAIACPVQSLYEL